MSLPMNLKTDLRAPNLWYDAYVRLLPGVTFVALCTYRFLNLNAFPNATEVALGLLAGYVTGMILQPPSSRIMILLEKLAARHRKVDEAYVREIQTGLGSNTRRSRILSKMHAEVGFHTQMAMFSLGFLLLEIFLSGGRCGHDAYLIVAGIATPYFICAAIEVADRRVGRAKKYAHAVSAHAGDET